jgi:hypothetical protein
LNGCCGKRAFLKLLTMPSGCPNTTKNFEEST